MQLETRILVRRKPEDVWSYLGEYSTVPEWDRGVGSVRHNPDTAAGVGFEFSTFGMESGSDSNAEHGKMSYRITEIDAVKGCTVQLTNSDGNARYFKEAKWSFKVDEAPDGALVTCAVLFKLRLKYIFLTPVFFLMRGAIHRDLEGLKRALENA
jgi:hypothetical protein